MNKPKKSCSICGKASMKRMLVSHSKRKTIDHAKPNLRKIRINDRGTIRAIWICMKCLKKGKVKPALPRRLTRPAAKAE